MLNAAIAILFVVICFFQPWMVVIFALFWLVGYRENQKQAAHNDAFAAHKAKAFKELDEKIEKIMAEEDENPPPETKSTRDRSHLRVVK